MPGATPDGSFTGDVYYLGIIDILQPYDLRKKSETLLKSLVHPHAAISATAPTFYAQRFVDFVGRFTE